MWRQVSLDSASFRQLLFLFLEPSIKRRQFHFSAFSLSIFWTLVLIADRFSMSMFSKSLIHWFFLSFRLAPRVSDPLAAILFDDFFSHRLITSLGITRERWIRIHHSRTPQQRRFFPFSWFVVCFFLSTSRSSCASSSSGVLRCPSAAVPVQYYKQSILYKETLHYMNTAFTALFSIECMLKIISFGVKVTAQQHANNNKWQQLYTSNHLNHPTTHTQWQQIVYL